VAGVHKVLIVDVFLIDMNVLIFFGGDIFEDLFGVGEDVDDLFDELLDELGLGFRSD